MSRNAPPSAKARALKRVLCLAALAAALAAAWGCSRGASGPAPIRTSERTRYDCLIIPALDRDEVASKGFPEYMRADLATEDDPVRPDASAGAQLLGTQVRIAVYGVDSDAANAAVAAAIRRVAELSQKLNLFDPASETARVNRDAAKAPVPIDADLAAVIVRSKEMAQLTGGVFDPTVGPLTDLWRRHRKEGKVPSDEDIARARELVGFDKVTLVEGAAPTVKFAREGMSFDFGGIAKGFAGEEAARVLVARGIRSAVIACGGDVKLLGRRPNGTPFRVGVADPRPQRPPRLRFIVPAAGAAIDTSGNYEQFTVIDGKVYSHIIDPRTGKSIEALPSVTVIGPDATVCDAVATAIGVLGVDEGMKLIEKLNSRAK